MTEERQSAAPAVMNIALGKLAQVHQSTPLQGSIHDVSLHWVNGKSQDYSVSFNVSNDCQRICWS